MYSPLFNTLFIPLSPFYYLLLPLSCSSCTPPFFFFQPLPLFVTPSSFPLQCHCRYLMQKVTWLLSGAKWLKATPKWQPCSQGFLITQLHNCLSFISHRAERQSASLSLSLFCSPWLLRLPSLPCSPLSLYSTEPLRSCLRDQNGCVYRGREKEGMRGRQRCWGVREKEMGVGVQSGYELQWCHICCRPTGWQRKDGMCHTAGRENWMCGRLKGIAIKVHFCLWGMCNSQFLKHESTDRMWQFAPKQSCV